jgi:glycerophosphoryl diester phosphodiesterase
VGPLRIAHRGDARRAPENTLPALMAALERPACDGVEFDVRLSADGVPVVLHDPTLARVWGRPERVDELSATALEDIGIPSLADVLTALPRRARLDIELKGRHDRAVVEVIAAGRGADLRDAAVSSFDMVTLERVAGLAPGWARWLNTWELGDDTIRTAVELGCTVVSAEFHAIDTGSAARVRAAGLGLAGWTVRRRPTFDRLTRLGAVAACVEGSLLDA